MYVLPFVAVRLRLQLARTYFAIADPATARQLPGLLLLTPAELRLLPYLQAHLTAGGIAEQLFVSCYTVKAEVKSIYRKLGVSSRHDAVQKATAIGLLGALAELDAAGVLALLASPLLAAGDGAADDPDPDPDDDHVPIDRYRSLPAGPHPCHLLAG